MDSFKFKLNKKYKVIVLLIVFLVREVYGVGVGITPAFSSISLKEGEIGKLKFTFSNPEKYEEIIDLSVKGCNEIIEITNHTIVLKPKGESIIEIRVNSKNAKNKSYECYLNGIISSKSNGGMNVIASTSAKINVKIEKERKISAKIKSLTVLQNENEVMFEVNVENNGNSKTKLEGVILEIDTINGTIEYKETKKNLPKINPGETKKIFLYWDSSKSNPGDYIAKVKILLPNDDVIEREHWLTVIEKPKSKIIIETSKIWIFIATTLVTIIIVSLIFKRKIK